MGWWSSCKLILVFEYKHCFFSSVLALAHSISSLAKKKLTLLSINTKLIILVSSTIQLSAITSTLCSQTWPTQSVLLKIQRVQLISAMRIKKLWLLWLAQSRMKLSTKESWSSPSSKITIELRAATSLASNSDVFSRNWNWFHLLRIYINYFFVNILTKETSERWTISNSALILIDPKTFSQNMFQRIQRKNWWFTMGNWEMLDLHFTIRQLKILM